MEKHQHQETAVTDEFRANHIQHAEALLQLHEEPFNVIKKQNSELTLPSASVPSSAVISTSSALPFTLPANTTRDPATRSPENLQHQRDKYAPPEVKNNETAAAVCPQKKSVSSLSSIHINDKSVASHYPQLLQHLNNLPAKEQLQTLQLLKQSQVNQLHTVTSPVVSGESDCSKTASNASGSNHQRTTSSLTSSTAEWIILDGQRNASNSTLSQEERSNLSSLGSVETPGDKNEYQSSNPASNIAWLKQLAELTQRQELKKTKSTIFNKAETENQSKRDKNVINIEAKSEKKSDGTNNIKGELLELMQRVTASVTGVRATSSKSHVTQHQQMTDDLQRPMTTLSDYHSLATSGAKAAHDEQIPTLQTSATNEQVPVPQCNVIQEAVATQSITSNTYSSTTIPHLEQMAMRQSNRAEGQDNVTVGRVNVCNQEQIIEQQTNDIIQNHIEGPRSGENQMVVSPYSSEPLVYQTVDVTTSPRIMALSTNQMVYFSNGCSNNVQTAEEIKTCTPIYQVVGTISNQQLSDANTNHVTAVQSRGLDGQGQEASSGIQHSNNQLQAQNDTLCESVKHRLLCEGSTQQPMIIQPQVQQTAVVGQILPLQTSQTEMISPLGGSAQYNLVSGSDHLLSNQVMAQTKLPCESILGIKCSQNSEILKQQSTTELQVNQVITPEGLPKMVGFVPQVLQRQQQQQPQQNRLTGFLAASPTDSSGMVYVPQSAVSPTIQLQPATSQLHPGVETVAASTQSILHPLKVPPMNSVAVEEEMSRMKRLIEELQQEVHSLKDQLHQTTINSHSKEMVDGLQKENIHLKEQLIKLVMAPKQKSVAKSEHNINMFDKTIKSEVRPCNSSLPDKQTQQQLQSQTDRSSPGIEDATEDTRYDSEISQTNVFPTIIGNISSQLGTGDNNTIQHKSKEHLEQMSRGKTSVSDDVENSHLNRLEKVSEAMPEPLDIASSTPVKVESIQDTADVADSTAVLEAAPTPKKSKRRGKSSLTYDSTGKVCCALCDKKFVHSASFYYHMKTHSGDRPYKCTHCSKAFYNSTHLKGHVRIHTGEKPSKCVICDKRFVEVSAMKRHMSTVHSDTKLHKCTQCDKAYKNLRDLRNHARTHESSDGKPYECTMCGKRFTCERYAKLCEKSHTGLMPYICTSCGKKFKSTESLRMHEQIHLDKPKHKCPHCDKTFKQQPSLYTHIRTHTRTNLHACEVCKKEFITKYRLRSHMMRHNGERPRKCTLCNKGFVEAHELTRHMRVHSDVSPYQCKYCDRTFKDHSNRTQHQKTHTKKANKYKSTNNDISNNETSETLMMDEESGKAQGQTEFEGHLVTTVLQPFSSNEQELVCSTEPVSVEVIPFVPTSSSSLSSHQDLIALPSQTGSDVITVGPDVSEGTTILDMDSGSTHQSN